MLTFKQFLKESKWDGLVYHATNKDFDPKDIKPGSHFGTLHAAMARMAPVKWLNKENKIKIHAYKLTMPDASKIYHGKDPGFRSDFRGKDKGAEVTTYKNTEEDPGKDSYVVYNTKLLKHVHTFDNPNYTKDKRRPFVKKLINYKQ